MLGAHREAARLAFARRLALLARARLGIQPRRLRLALAQLLAQGVEATPLPGGGLQRELQRLARLLLVLGDAVELRLGDIAARGKIAETRERADQALALEFLGELGVAPRLARLDLEAALARLVLAQDIEQAREVVARALQLALRLLAARAVLGNAGRLLEDKAALGRRSMLPCSMTVSAPGPPPESISNSRTSRRRTRLPLSRYSLSPER